MTFLEFVSSFWYFVSMRHLFFLVLLRSALTEKYIIDRQVELDRGSWIDQPDRFMLPTSMCSAGDISANCTAMGGTRLGNTCGCVCNKKNEFSEFYQSTFGFYDNRWKCFENKKVRSHGDCKTILNDRQDTIHLMTLPMSKPSVGHNVPGLAMPTTCDITGGKYLKCDGNWQQLNITLVKSRFYLQKDSHTFLYYSISQPFTPTINGRVIKLEIGCTEPNTTQCVLFKVKGQLKCPVTMSTSPSPSTTWRSISSNTETHEATTISLIDLAVTESQFNITSESASNQGNNIGLIAGAVAGVIGLALIAIAVLMLMRRRRRKRYPVPKEKDVAVENESYGLGVDTTLRFIVPGQRSQDEDHYCYTTKINDGVLQSVAFQRNTRNYTESPLDVEAHRNEHSENQEYAIPCKTTTQSQPGSGSGSGSGAPIYDSLEEHEYANNGERGSNNESERLPEPLYNVLEEPSGNCEFEEPPCYPAASEELLSEGTCEYPSEPNMVSSLDGNDAQEYSTLNDSKVTDRNDKTIYNYVGEVMTG